jgi:hypothetical protein
LTAFRFEARIVNLVHASNGEYDAALAAYAESH